MFFSRFTFLISFCLFFLSTAFGQNSFNQGILTGIILDKNTQKPLAGFTLLLNPGASSVVSDSLGRFRFSDLNPGTYIITITGVGYNTKTLENLLVTNGNVNNISIELEASSVVLDNVTVTGRKNNVRATSLETPLSVQRLTTEEIKRNPGGNFDISKVVQSLPGVGGGAGGGGFRNDLVVRGGAPSENVYYLDGIEIPVLNHFGTQGSGGGPQGILNANFIEDVKMNTSAFDARYDNALSSVLQFRQKTGNSQKSQGNVILSATDLAITADGPLAKNTTYLASVRRSYLQFLFKAIDLPIRPNYWDYQLKINTRLGSKTTLSLVGIGAIDEFSFARPRNASPEKLYVINSNPSINQWNYTVGASIKKLIKNGFVNLSVSRNTLNNQVEKYEDNENPTLASRTLFTDSRETENKLRIDATHNSKGWKVSYGLMAQYVDFNNRFENVYRKELVDTNGNIVQPEIRISAATSTDFFKYGGFLQVGRRILNERMAVSAGARIDGNSLATSESNPFKQFSPRLSLSYALTNQWNLNASVGRYFKLPSYTQLAFFNQANNRANPGSYIQSDHYVLGTEYVPTSSLRFTVEGFYKKYSNYPVSLLDGVSLANKGSDFGSIGNEPIVQSGKGRAFGLELFAQKKLSKRFFGILSYTFYRSEFTRLDGIYLPASWDNRHLLSATWGYKFKRNWELGLKFRLQGKAPFSPFDLEQSQLNYLSIGTGVLDYSRFNSERLPVFHASDVRIDKKWNYRKFTLDVFLDVTNWYAAKVPGPPQYTFTRNAENTSFISNDGNAVKPDGSNAIPLILKNNDATPTPTFGLIVEF
ncbi:MAG: TonB-dependent receptor [Bacteroidota bacterium]